VSIGLSQLKVKEGKISEIFREGKTPESLPKEKGAVRCKA